MLRIFILMLMTFTLFSCSSDDSKTNHQAEVEKQNKKEHMLSDQEKLLEKARKAEEDLKKADEKRRKALEDQGG